MINNKIRKIITGISFRVSTLQLLISLISLVVLIFLLQWIAVKSMEKQIIKNNQWVLDYITNNIDKTVNQIKDQVSHEANQPTILKILMLPEYESKTYIEEYINDIYFFNISPIISLYNFKGDKIYSQVDSSFNIKSSFYAKMCISSMQTYLAISDMNIIHILSPVMYNNLPEGALGITFQVDDFFIKNIKDMVSKEHTSTLSIYKERSCVYKLGEIKDKDKLLSKKFNTLDLELSVFASKEELTGSVDSMKFNMIIIGSTFILISIAIGFIFSRKMLVIPILKLRNSVLEINYNKWTPLEINNITVFELQELAKAFNEMQTIAKEKTGMLLHSEKLAAIGQLAAGVAHEINNPLSFISGNTETITDYLNALKELINLYEQKADEKTLQSKKKELDIEFILSDIDDLLIDNTEGLKRVKQIVASLKDFSRMDELGQHIETDIEKNLDHTLMVVNNEIKYYAKVIKHYGNVPHIQCNCGEINQVFMNIIINSAHAIRDNNKDVEGIIIITTTQPNADYIQISIKDNGPGIKEENIEKIFDPFFTTKTIGEGTGLGLNISYDIIKNKHKGTIKAESKEGEGTEFIITLPIKKVIQDG